MRSKSVRMCWQARVYTEEAVQAMRAETSFGALMSHLDVADDVVAHSVPRFPWASTYCTCVSIA